MMVNLHSDTLSPSADAIQANGGSFGVLGYEPGTEIGSISFGRTSIHSIVAEEGDFFLSVGFAAAIRAGGERPCGFLVGNVVLPADSLSSWDAPAWDVSA
jgi:hypothetical protein